MLVAIPSARQSGPLAESATRNGVRVTVALDRAAVVPGDRVRATLTVENVGDDPVSWVHGACVIWQDVIILANGDGANHYFHSFDEPAGDGPPYVCPAIAVGTAIEPGGSVSYGGWWDALRSNGSSVREGEWLVQATIMRLTRASAPDDDDRFSVRVVVPLIVEGDP